MFAKHELNKFLRLNENRVSLHVNRSVKLKATIHVCGFVYIQYIKKLVLLNHRDSDFQCLVYFSPSVHRTPADMCISPQLPTSSGHSVLLTAQVKRSEIFIL